MYLTRDSLPVIGLLWNPRLLPFLYLLRYMLMMVGIVETRRRRGARHRGARRVARGSTWTVGLATAAVGRRRSCWSCELFLFQQVPGARVPDAATARACTRGASAIATRSR